MARTKLYTAIYGVLFVLATAQALLEGAMEEAYWLVFGGILVLSFVKALFVAGYYQHLRWEPRSVTYVIATGLLAAVVLTLAAAYSIT
ncbi:MAG: cytochrome C oxidase subunit IV family protein [Halobacteriales archaeon]